MEAQDDFFCQSFLHHFMRHYQRNSNEDLSKYLKGENSFPNNKDFHKNTINLLKENIYPPFFPAPFLKLFCLSFIKYLCNANKKIPAPSDETFFLNVPQDPTWLEIIEQKSHKLLYEWISKFEELPENRILYGVFSTVLIGEDIADGMFDHVFENEISNFMVEIDKDTYEREDIIEFFSNVIELPSEYSGIRKFENSTPQIFLPIISSIIEPSSISSIYDPACGIGNTLLYAYDLLRSDEGNNRQIHLFGQDINGNIVAIAKLNLFFNDVRNGYLEIGNTLHHPKFLENSDLRKFDLIICNPQIGSRIDNDQIEQLREDKFKRFFSINHRIDEELLFIQHVVSSLKVDGKAAILGSSKVLIEASGLETRKHLVDEDIIEVIISLPSGLFQETSIPFSIILINKNKDESLKNKVLFIYGDEEYSYDGKNKNLEKEVEQLENALRQKSIVILQYLL